ncbi:50S ribosomal protein L44e [archaeon]|nr:50S ribosomal protein L44e [archaeon]
MKMPDKIRTYCPHCRKHTEHKVKLYKKGRTRPTAQGQKRHDLKTHGYTSKIAGKVTVYKQAKTPTFVLTCSQCSKKHPKSFKSRTKKITELVKK